MLTVNLEKKLVRENKKLVTPAELLLINEYEKHTEIVDNEVLQRLGLNRNIKQGERYQSDVNYLKKATEKFDQKRVFHISQIESICKKYHLRFLPIRHYSGSIDNELPVKITTFEIAHRAVVQSNNSYIMAPAKSFKLEEKPKDPLFFYEINSEYFYLIHKWGNDLNIFRRALPFLAKPWVMNLFFVSLSWLPFLITLNPYWIILSGFITVLFPVINAICGFESKSDAQGGGFGFVRKNEWNSKFK